MIQMVDVTELRGLWKCLPNQKIPQNTCTYEAHLIKVFLNKVAFIH